MTPDERLSVGLNNIAHRLEDMLSLSAGLDRPPPFLLLVAPTKNVQYVANVARKDGIGLIKNLLARWSEAAGDAPIDLPEHQKDQIILKLLAAIREIASRGGTISAPVARNVLADIEPTLAFFAELSEKGPIDIPPAAQRN